MRKASFSQFSMWKGCPRKYKLTYIDKLGSGGDSIATCFGTSLHEVVQSFLEDYYSTDKTKKMVMNNDLSKMLLERMKHNFKLSKDKTGEPPATMDELMDHYKDGCETLFYFKKNVNKFYSKRGFELVGIEVPLKKIFPQNVEFTAYIDVLLKEKKTGVYHIIDIKTSKKGWSKYYEKKDEVKKAQLLLYKRYYAEQFGVSEDKIKVEFQIFKRKPVETEFTNPRVSVFVPAHGKVSVNRANEMFTEFVDTIFGEDGERRADIPYETKPQVLCGWCEFADRGLCDGLKIHEQQKAKK